jgi:O-acetyl-ADP-ribose deacetylase (regulator of RNase III)
MPKTGGCPPGEARLTGGHHSPASHVIHTVGRVEQPGSKQILESCYLSCLEIARSQGFRDIAFPAIATGVYGFPREAAALVAVSTIGSQQLPELVIFVCFDTATLNAYRNAVGYEGWEWAAVPISALIDTFAF